MQLGWIDFSKTERSKILSVLDSLTEDGTLDELGIAPIRDGFSNLFFPGTSTLQTRAKYYFIIPYAFKDLELSPETNPNRLLKALDEMERKCAEIFLEQNRDENGVIGKNSLRNGKWVKRSPSDIYWAGIRKYGIFTGGNMSITEYVRAFCSIKNQKETLKSLGNRNDSADADDIDAENAGSVFKMQFWKMPLYKRDWLESLSVSLTEAEGAFLKDRIVHNCPDSLMAYILENSMTEILACKSFSELDAFAAEFPKHIRDDYVLALEFSDFMYAVRVVYNIMISDRKNSYADREFERIKEDLKDRADIDIDRILSKFGIIKRDLESFLKQIQLCMKNKDIEGLQACIRSREIFLKGANRAKTMHPGEFSPEIWRGGGEMGYRFNNARAIIADIFESEGKNAES